MLTSMSALAAMGGGMGLPQFQGMGGMGGMGGMTGMPGLSMNGLGTNSNLQSMGGQGLNPGGLGQGFPPQGMNGLGGMMPNMQSMQALQALQSLGKFFFYFRWNDEPRIDGRSSKSPAVWKCEHH